MLRFLGLFANPRRGLFTSPCRSAFPRQMSTTDQLAGYETEVAVGKALSGIGFPCWLKEQQSDPLVLRLSARVPFG